MNPTRLAPAVLLVALAATACGPEPTAESEKPTAAATCQEHVERSWESLVSAEFETSSDITVTSAEDPWEYEVVASATTENDAGEVERAEYRCFAVNNSGDWFVVDMRDVA
ncbi:MULTISPECIES: GIY-YIG nuclease family protein [Nocardiopsis]|uniref:Lipoprotein n=1 Tax=Nocardiopsis dassonvillei (strain ATCC 23218 / DSM 43111 / CIP 107115 / JCM 7437 / KCTC 9190 / NBRC 14626 / NCTC 10488 / NRRL B-5397 / IMRU 509) TaxID=446468 RepID=D7B6P5_NOCDD|nr:GIY-YIG nuclease family protein [Nocardiopsis dassonvillei]ADH69332.1 conserved hypothetical protein [Nocardiopsis dassonvillei subsp. dassonvillei DSM 43111]APC37353.1 hypothetical protein A9R04_22945 [Nocardiopsis dassonvillei]MCK9870798.1 GIY-YIG nuclease family protein [Nocardiopsis dassonvillei]NKY81080.1 GIY-YIG nuclease family protein [Nocardiopsis dassonvillei]VEI89842.1 Uncharacterised protein [Nocardiopsis dassonvillei]